MIAYMALNSNYFANYNAHLVDSSIVCFVLNDNPREMTPSAEYLAWHKKYLPYMPRDRYFEEWLIMRSDAANYDICWRGLGISQIGNPAYGKTFRIDSVLFRDILLTGQIIPQSTLQVSTKNGNGKGSIMCTLSDLDRRLHCAFSANSELNPLGEYDVFLFSIKGENLTLIQIHTPPEYVKERRRILEAEITDSSYNKTL